MIATSILPHPTKVVLAAIAMLLTAGLAQAQDFVPGAEDLPLMGGLRIQEEGSVVFDSPNGRVVEAFATGLLEEDDVLVFYSETLPEMGWRQTGPRAFEREDETLTFDFSEQDEFLVVRFTLAPQ